MQLYCLIIRSRNLGTNRRSVSTFHINSGQITNHPIWEFWILSFENFHFQNENIRNNFLIGLLSKVKYYNCNIKYKAFTYYTYYKECNKCKALLRCLPPENNKWRSHMLSMKAAFQRGGVDCGQNFSFFFTSQGLCFFFI